MSDPSAKDPLQALQSLESAVKNQTLLVLNQLRTAQDAFIASLLANERYSDPKRLARFEFQVHSQNGEDGVIAEIFRRLGSPGRTFLEIGVGWGPENNTCFLLSQGWRGVWIDSDPDAIRYIRQNFMGPLSDGSLRAVELFSTMENIRPALDQAGVGEEFDLLSIDVDQNTYWIWSAFKGLRPKVVVVEYNPTFPPDVDWKARYEPNRVWDGSNYFGASLKAFERLGRELGYRLVGCEITGTNAFFVREDLCGDRFFAPFDAETHYEPARYYLNHTRGYWKGTGEFGKAG